MKSKILCFVLAFLVSLIFCRQTACAEPKNENEYKSDAYVLMEASTGTVITSKNAEKQLRPASITKIMTLLIVFEEIDSGRLSYEDKVIVSEHAASMGGSQVYLEQNEVMSVNELIKCISIASANDASVAIAEHIAGSEEQFVRRMNQKAADIGMKHTRFVNCYGLDTDGHYTTALDVAIMSKELITMHPDIFRYSTVWMDSIVHVTKKGSSEFGLSNTNKLLKSFQGITGLKTGSTGLAKYCLSATARRDNMDLIAVVMAAPDTKTRFQEAAGLLNYGFSACKIYRHSIEDELIPDLLLRNGVESQIKLQTEQEFVYLCLEGEDINEITYEIITDEACEAPVNVNQVFGKVIYSYHDKELGTVSLIPVKAYEKAGFFDVMVKTIFRFLLRNTNNSM